MFFFAIVTLKPTRTRSLMFGGTVRALYKGYIFWVVPYVGYENQCAVVAQMINNHFTALCVTASLWFH